MLRFHVFASCLDFYFVQASYRWRVVGFQMCSVHLQLHVQATSSFTRCGHIFLFHLSLHIYYLLLSGISEKKHFLASRHLPRMGAEESVPIPRPPPSSYPDQTSPYFMFSLYLNTIHLVYAPQTVLNIFVRSSKTTLGSSAIEYHKPKLEHGYKIVFNESLFRSEFV